MCFIIIDIALYSLLCHEGYNYAMRDTLRMGILLLVTLKRKRITNNRQAYTEQNRLQKKR